MLRFQGAALADHGRRKAVTAGAVQSVRQCHQVHCQGGHCGFGRRPRTGSASHPRHRHRHRHDRGRATQGVRGIHAGQCRHQAPLWRNRTGPVDFKKTGQGNGRRDHGDVDARRGLGLRGPASLHGNHLAYAFTAPRGPILHHRRQPNDHRRAHLPDTRGAWRTGLVGGNPRRTSENPDRRSGGSDRRHHLRQRACRPVAQLGRDIRGGSRRHGRSSSW